MRWIVLVAVSVAWPASAQEYPPQALVHRLDVSPTLGEPTTVTAGSPIFERAATTTVLITSLEEKAHFGGFLGADIEAGTKLYIVSREPEVQACINYDLAGYAPRVQYCVFDVDRDGQFDFGQWGGPERDAKLDKMKKPVRYATPTPVAATNPKGDMTERLIYLGVTDKTLRLSHREFVNDMARPAFTEEVTFNLSGKYPETVAYKDLSIDILGVGNAGLSYVIRKAGN